MSCGAEPSPPEVFDQHARDQRVPTSRQARYLEEAAKRNGKTVAQLIQAGIEHRRLHHSTPCPQPGPDESATWIQDTLTRSQAGALFEIIHAWESSGSDQNDTEERGDWDRTGETSFWRKFGRLRLHVIRGRGGSHDWIWGAFALQGREQEADWESGYATPEEAMVEAERFAASWHEEETHATLARKAKPSPTVTDGTI